MPSTNFVEEFVDVLLIVPKRLGLLTLNLLLYVLLLPFILITVLFAVVGAPFMIIGLSLQGKTLWNGSQKGFET